jgi:hypothetical protein
MQQSYYVTNHKGKSPLRSPSYRWEDNIAMYPKYTGHEYVVWIDVAQDIEIWWLL